ncbi:class I SAM-dependent methyltransferase [Labrenzia sp. PHM005]|uniref:class I SAM-dependent methyltransferase n=1 Tax=Labrenzia sp. PHM005 TaxID=2590016 RepID=UPI0011400D4E|nr:class I SAM-dependent methyltransferase [Labrenzia sp. PHM005]QDG75026.1 methyltransferase domain-containing protein [Labrenzia sp. PHM005]
MASELKDLRQRLVDRLSATVEQKISSIGYVPEDLVRIAGSGVPAEPSHDEVYKAPEDLKEAINEHYDFSFYARETIWADMLAGTHFRNIGYWDANTESLDQAGRNLQDQLLALLPQKTGRILDVACGMGASTKRLLDTYRPEDVWAINISAKQIETTSQNAPGCNAQVMSATEMTFEDNFFDAVECIEAAFHFDTRRKFLEDTLRILKPGGRLVMSDVLMTSGARLEQYPVFPNPENHIATIEDYKSVLEEIGYENITISDERNNIWKSHFMATTNRIHEGFLARKYNIVEVTDMIWTYYELDAITGPCPILGASKPR